MPVTITIRGTPIDFPSVGESPNWAESVIEFAQAVEQALEIAVGPFDVPPQVLDISAYNPGTDITIPNLSFSTTSVRAAFIKYAVYRTTDTNTAYEDGRLEIIFNPNGSVNSKWEVIREYGGDGSISFSITDAGQVKFSTVTLTGSNHSGRLTFVAQSLAQE